MGKDSKVSPEQIKALRPFLRRLAATLGPPRWVLFGAEPSVDDYVALSAAFRPPLLWSDVYGQSEPRLSRPAARCGKCRDTGTYEDDPDTGAQVYCECPIGAAFTSAWGGTGREEETVAAIEKMREFLLGGSGSPVEDSPGPTVEPRTAGGGHARPEPSGSVAGNVAEPQLGPEAHRAEPPTLLSATKAVLEQVDALAAESSGVAGLHRNGDIADWAWLYTTWLSSLVGARDAVAAAEAAAPEAGRAFRS